MASEEEDHLVQRLLGTAEAASGGTDDVPSPLEPASQRLGEDLQEVLLPTPASTGTARARLHDAAAILRLSVPIFMSRVSSVAMRTTDTALLGHVGTDYLAASAMADLWTASTGTCVRGSILRTFCSQAIGAGNPALAGVWLQVSLTVLACLFLPVFVLWLLTYPVLVALGTATDIAAYAAYYAAVLSLALPAQIAFSQLSAFLLCQQVTMPEVAASAVAMATNLALGVVLVFGVPIPGWPGLGFPACPVVTTAVEWLKLGLLVLLACVVQRAHAPCWPADGWAVHHVTWPRVREYVRLYAPAALAISSDFWRMSAVGAVAAWLGPLELAVFNTSYRIMWMCLTVTRAVASAALVKLGHAFGAGQPGRAHELFLVALSLTIVLLTILCTLVVAIPRELARIFSNDSAIIDLFEHVRVPLAVTVMFMNLSVFLESVLASMGRTRLLLILSLVGSWAGQVPAAFLLARFWRSDLNSVFAGVAIGYIILTVPSVWAVVSSDWALYAREARERSEVSDGKGLQAAPTAPLRSAAQDEEEQAGMDL